jgi:hypothetical protein
VRGISVLVPNGPICPDGLIGWQARCLPQSKCCWEHFKWKLDSDMDRHRHGLRSFGLRYYMPFAVLSVCLEQRPVVLRCPRPHGRPRDLAGPGVTSVAVGYGIHVPVGVHSCERHGHAHRTRRGAALGLTAGKHKQRAGGAMTPSRLATMLIAVIVCIGVTPAKEFYFASQARDPGVKRWIWYQVLGPANSPYTIVYLSVERFKTIGGEDLVVLPPTRYHIISSYTEWRIKRSDCAGDTAQANAWYSVQIAEHEKGQTRQCILPQRSACQYFSRARRLHGINWTADELRPIAGFMAQIKCYTFGAVRDQGRTK